MRYTNAGIGVKKIYTAVILLLIAAGLSLVAGILGLFGEAAEVVAAFIVIAAAIMMIVSEIMKIIGVNRASRDEPAFKKALIALIVGIGANALVTVFSENALLSGIGSFVSSITEFLASFFICTGIINLAQQLRNAAVSDKGRKTRTLLMGIFIASAALSLLSTIFTAGVKLPTVATVVTIIDSVITIGAYIVYLQLLSDAKKMLGR